MTSEKLNLNHIDLFAGCGGLSLGLHNAGWKGLFAIEKDPDAFTTLKHNLIEKRAHFDWPSWLPEKNHDIKEVIKTYKCELEALSGTITLVAGGPPCQGFSMAGRRKENDQRNTLVNSYIEFIKIVRPKYLFFENVFGFTIGFKKEEKNSEAYSEYVKNELHKLGYNPYANVIDFSEFGVPQRRRRFILVGALRGNSKTFFEKLTTNRASVLQAKNLTPTITISEAISDLLKENNLTDSPDTKGFKAGKYSPPVSAYQRLMRCGVDGANGAVDSHRFPNHRGNTIERFKLLVSEAPRDENISKYLSDIFGTRKKYVVVLDKDLPSPTLTTLPDDYIHFAEPRILTVREYARLQSFPDDFEFKGNYTTGGKARVKEVPRYSQIGNAIPPLFAEQSGIALKEMAING